MVSIFGLICFEKMCWDGKDKDGKVVVNGIYIYCVCYILISLGVKE